MPLPDKYKRLNLSELDEESGLYNLASRSSVSVIRSGKKCAAANSIYFSLTREYPINYLHWLRPDNHHVLIDGGAVDFYLFFPNGRSEHVRMGRDLEAGEQMIVVAPAGCWKCAILDPEADYSLMASVVSPAWSLSDVKVGAGEPFLDIFTGTNTWASREFLLEMIGPNFIDASKRYSGQHDGAGILTNI